MHKSQALKLGSNAILGLLLILFGMSLSIRIIDLYWAVQAKLGSPVLLFILGYLSLCSWCLVKYLERVERWTGRSILLLIGRLCLRLIAFMLLVGFVYTGALMNWLVTAFVLAATGFLMFAVSKFTTRMAD